MKIKVPTWSAHFLLAYLGLVTLTPAAYVLSGLIAHIFLVGAASTILVLQLFALLQSNSKPTLSPYAIVLQAPLLGILIVYSLSLLLGEAIPAYDKLAALRAIAVPIIIYLLVGYLALNVSYPVLSVRLLRGIIFILSSAAIIGIFLSLAQINTVDVVRFFGLSPSNEHVEQLLGVLDVRFLGLKRAQGFFSHPLEYGASLVLAYSVVRAKPSMFEHKYTRWTLCFLLLLGIFFSASTSMWIGVVLVELIIRYLKVPRTLNRIAIAIIPVLMVAILVLLLNFKTITSSVSNFHLGNASLEKSLAIRVGHYEPAVDAFLDHPILGVGNWQYYMESQGIGPEHPNYYLDNDYLRFLAEAGVLGLMVYAMFVFRGLMAPYFLARCDRFFVFLLTALYAYQAAAFDAFGFRIYTGIYIVLFAVALRFKEASEEELGVASNRWSIGTLSPAQHNIEVTSDELTTQPGGQAESDPEVLQRNTGSRNASNWFFIVLALLIAVVDLLRRWVRR